MSIESIIEKAVQQMETWAWDNSHGYDQAQRWGERGDYDCSSAVISAWEIAGIPVKTKGATYTGNMYSVFLRCGFEDVTGAVDLVHGSGLQRGDVLLNHKNHTAMYAGGGKTVEASINEHGTTTGGTPGDQTGAEFLMRLYRNYPWDVVLRYTGKESSAKPESSTTAPTYFYNNIRLPLLKKGMESPYIKMLQEILAARDYYTGEIDGIYGAKFEAAVLGVQADAGLITDGEIGPDTYDAIFGGKV